MFVGGGEDTCSVSNFWTDLMANSAGLGPQGRTPKKLSVRNMRLAIEEALIGGFTRVALETVLPEELGLDWKGDEPPGSSDTKRSLIDGYIEGWGLPQLAALARRVVTEIDIHEAHVADLKQLLELFDAGGGVAGSPKNLIFSANGPKPEIVLRDAMNNDIEIVKNAEYCLVYDQPIPPEGLRFAHLVDWWRHRAAFGADVPERDVALSLHARLRESLADNEAELAVFNAYARRYKNKSFDIPVLIPQVYLHYDPYDQRTRQASTGATPLTRQRMDFLLLFSDRKRVVIEVDGKQHYATGDKADPALYSEMVAEDRRLRLAGYEVYRFGGHELFQDDAPAMLADFFDQLERRMK